MTQQTYSLVPSRNLIRAAREMLKHAEPILVMTPFAKQEAQPARSTDTVVFRRVLPVDAAANGAPRPTAANYILSEGVTPAARTITYQDVTTTLQNYGVLMRLTNKAEAMYEDDIPGDMVTIVGEHMASLEELINYGATRAGTNVVFSNGASRAAVNTAVNRNVVQKSVRSLQAAHAMRMTQRLSASPDFGTSPIPESFVAFIHTDLEHDISNIPGFVPVEEYGTFKPVSAREYGKVGFVRFVSSPYFSSFANAGSATLNGMIGGTNVDVYTTIVVGKEAWGCVAVKGYGAVKPVYLPAKQRNHANPMGQFGYVGADFWKSSVRLNENWLVRIESGATAL